MNRILTLTLVLMPFWIAKADTPPLADPFILLEGDTYYAYGTHAADGIEVYTSTNLMTPVAGTLRECIHVTEPWENRLGRVCEGPFVVEHDGLYYLTYSANDYQSQDYGVFDGSKLTVE